MRRRWLQGRRRRAALAWFGFGFGFGVGFGFGFGFGLEEPRFPERVTALDEHLLPPGETN
jgi:hypothetical protein